MPARNRFQYLIPDPIDFEALMASRGQRTMRGDRRPREHVERQQASRKANLAAKEKERVSLRPRVKKRKVEIPLKVRIAKLFQPKLFYADPDVVRLARSATPSIPRGSARARLITMTRDGDLERVQNPEWTGPTVYPKGVPFHLVDRGAPQWLYRLTEQGEALRLL